jgi:hypothetical protein
VGLGSGILIRPRDFPEVFLAFFGGFGPIGAFRLLAQLPEAPALDPVEGFSEESTPGLRVKVGMAGIEITPSNAGMGEIKLSKSCIGTIRI